LRPHTLVTRSNPRVVAFITGTRLTRIRIVRPEFADFTVLSWTQVSASRSAPRVMSRVVECFQGLLSTSTETPSKPALISTESGFADAVGPIAEPL